MFTKNNYIKRGDYTPTTLDEYKANVDFLITSVGKRYEIIFNHHTKLKTNRSVSRIDGGEFFKDRAYLVTEKALEELKQKYTWATDF